MSADDIGTIAKNVVKPLSVNMGFGIRQRSTKVVDRPDALVSFEELHDIMGMHEVEELEQRFLTPEQLEAKYGSGRKASIMPDAKPAKSKQTA